MVDTKCPLLHSDLTIQPQQTRVRTGPDAGFKPQDWLGAGPGVGWSGHGARTRQGMLSHAGPSWREPRHLSNTRHQPSKGHPPSSTNSHAVSPTTPPSVMPSASRCSRARADTPALRAGRADAGSPMHRDHDAAPRGGSIRAPAAELWRSGAGVSRLAAQQERRTRIGPALGSDDAVTLELRRPDSVTARDDGITLELRRPAIAVGGDDAVTLELRRPDNAVGGDGAVTLELRRRLRRRENAVWSADAVTVERYWTPPLGRR